MSKMNLKKVSVSLLIVMILSLTIGSAFFFLSGGFTLNNAFNAVLGGTTYDVEEEILFSLEELVDLNINSVSTKINFINTEDTVGRVHYHGTITTNNEKSIPTLKVSESNTTVNIAFEYPKSITNTVTRNNTVLDIYLPTSYMGNLDVSTISGSVSIMDYHFNNFSFKSTSGNLTAYNIEATDINYYTTSGRFKTSVICDSIYFRSVSGRIEISNIKSNSTEISTTSGNATLSGNPGKLNFSSVSGNLHGTIETFNNNIVIKTTSGKTNLKLPASSEFDLDFSTVSGKFNNQFSMVYRTQGKRQMSGVIGNNPSNLSIKANSVSGNLDITY
ncbi:putative adhesin [Natranaerovirga pectinivora]|uniref:Putative adhesin n=1 Tax=Natranaerovirga pectinivora TaxID=682400 RepID=A0A4R3MN90_9FIRM|nr:DUF4097 family beta strand repeat-containing protein [Natranaerovirga pectinivora]TCT14062.1 putative adhesin [Natranaerovirga pectinivora]